MTLQEQIEYALKKKPNELFAINWRQTTQISECEYQTITRTILVDRNDTIGQIVDKIRDGKDFSINVELNSMDKIS